jgi:hypothetical protein
MGSLTMGIDVNQTVWKAARLVLAQRLISACHVRRGTFLRTGPRACACHVRKRKLTTRERTVSYYVSRETLRVDRVYVRQISGMTTPASCASTVRSTASFAPFLVSV